MAKKDLLSYNNFVPNPKMNNPEIDNSILKGLGKSFNNNSTFEPEFAGDFGGVGIGESKYDLGTVPKDIESITTGIGDKTTNIIQITLCKSMQNDNYKNAQKETGNAYLTRVMDGRGESGDVLTNTIRYIIRTNMRNLGITQSAVSIEYGESNDIDSSEATVFATMTVSQEDHQKYILT